MADNAALPTFLAPLNNGRALSASYGSLMARESVRHGFQGQFAADVALRRANESKNRYRDILPYDATRVRLPRDVYTNANWVAEPKSLVEGHTSSRRWLATQGPLKETIYAFWSLMLALPSADAPRRIVMLTALTEGSRVKCDRYFPATTSSPPLLLRSPDKRDPDIQVRLHSSNKPHTVYKRNSIHVGYVDQPPIEIEHLECLAWHDHGVPERPDDLLALLDAIGDGCDEPPTLVHCSAGVGRTGTLIATSALLSAIPALKKADKLRTLRPPEIEQPSLPALRKEDLADPVALTIDHLRAQRCLMVQTEEQQRYIYACLARAWYA